MNHVVIFLISDTYYWILDVIGCRMNHPTVVYILAVLSDSVNNLSLVVLGF